MSITEQITVGMAIYGFDMLPIGPVEGVSADGIEVGGRQIPGAAIDRVTADAVHLKIAGGALLARHDEQTERAGALP